MRLDEFLELSKEIEELKNTIEKIWQEVGPYGGKLDLCSPANKALRKYFDFDDGE